MVSYIFKTIRKIGQTHGLVSCQHWLQLLYFVVVCVYDWSFCYLEDDQRPE